MSARLVETRPGANTRPRETRFELTPRPLVYAGNRIRLLVNGEQYFPQLLAAIEASRRSIYLETYLFADDRIGQRVADALVAAAARGVSVRLVIDGFGGGEFARRLVTEIGAHGVEAKIYRSERWWRLERKLLRRLHRKIAVIDEALAFVGGINIIDDLNFRDADDPKIGPRFDFAVACEGPIVAAATLAAKRLWWTMSFVDPRATAGRLPLAERQPRPNAFPGGVAASLLLRDNLRNRRSIERAYLEAIDTARDDVLIANAYFVPGRRLRAALRDAAARGVRVRLLLQGRVEYAIHHYGQQALYGTLLDAGVEIYEYLPSFLHAKVAVIDGHWSTVGSSNIDPYSLLLAREANLVVYDDGFAREMSGVLDAAIARDAYQVKAEDFRSRGALVRAFNWIAYGLLRLATVVLARGKDY